MLLIHRILLLFMLLPCLAHAQTFRWVKAGQGTRTNTQGWDYQANGVACAAGVVAATGYYAETLTLDNSTFTSLAGSYPNAFTGLWTPNGTKQWLQSGGGVGVTPPLFGAYFSGDAIGLDATGNSYVLYTINEDAQFDTIFVRLAGNRQATVLAKYNRAGQIQWARTIRYGNLQCQIEKMAVMPNGTVVVGGYFAGNFTIGGQLLTTQADFEGFFATYDNAGNFLWAKQLVTVRQPRGGSGIGAVAFDGAGNILVTGCFDDIINLDAATSFVATAISVPSNLSSRNDGFLAKYTPQGVLLWARQFGSPGWDCGTAVVADNAGNVFLGGRYGYSGSDPGAGQGPLTGTFGSTPGTPTATLTVSPIWQGQGYWDGFIARYTPQGTLSWVRGISGVLSERVCALATSNQGAVYVSGNAITGTAFSATTSLPPMPFGNQGYVAKYDNAGTLRWLQGYGGNSARASNFNAGLGIASDGVGHIYTCGAFQGNTTFGTISAVGNASLVQYPYLAALDDNEIILSAKNPAQATAQLTAYPNPSTGRIQLEWPPNLRPTRLDVRDVLGRLLHTETVSPAATGQILELGTLPKGIYLVQLQTAGQQLTRRLVLE